MLRKNNVHDYICDWILKGFGGIMFAQRQRRWPIITSALGQCIVLSGKWPFWPRGKKASTALLCGSTSQQTRDNHPMLFQCWASVKSRNSTLKQHWVNVMCSLMCWRKLYIRPSVGLVLGQHRRRLTGIEPVMGCVAGPTLNRNWVGRPTSYVHAAARFTGNTTIE